MRLMSELDEEAGPSCAPLVKPADSNVPFRRRKYSSLRPFSTIATKSNIFGSTSNSNADVPVCQLERFTPIVLNKNVQRVQAAKEFIENSAGAENLEDFSAVRKQTYYPQDGSEDQIRELQVPREVFPPTENLVVKQHLVLRILEAQVHPPSWFDSGQLNINNVRPRRNKAVPEAKQLTEIIGSILNVSV